MVNFADVKERFDFAAVIELLELKLTQSDNQWRGACPRCKAGGDRTLTITEGRGFYCFNSKKGGDQLALVAHIRNLQVKEAAEWLDSSDAPEPEKPKEGFPALTYLESEHSAVSAVGFSVDFAKKNGIGYANRGILRGTIAIPFRDEQGTLLGYLGIMAATLPKDFR